MLIFLLIVIGLLLLSLVLSSERAKEILGEMIIKTLKIIIWVIVGIIAFIAILLIFFY